MIRGPRGKKFSTPAGPGRVCVVGEIGVQGWVSQGDFPAYP
jgi:hypothetical protein